MTLILTMITNHGILQASDSSLTSSDSGNAAGTSVKVFSLEFAAGAVALAGAFNVGSESMATWMPAAISTFEASRTPTLAGLADELRRRLELEMTDAQKSSGSLLHIAGYATEGTSSHPEFHFVRNITGIDARTGNYTGIGGQFVATEDFWSRDYQTAETRAAFAAGGHQIYINGYPHGRIGYLGLNRALDRFFGTVWQQPSWSFRAPQSLDEFALFVELKLRIISTMFVVSDYRAPLVGGEPQVFKIARVGGSVTL